MNRNLNRRIHPIAEADGLSPKKPRKYYVPAPKPFAKSMCGLKEKPTNRKDRVCKDWEYKY